MKKLAILLLTWNRESITKECLTENLKRIGFNRNDFELLICDQGSESKSLKAFLREQNPIYFRENMWNEGITRALNQLAIRSTAQHIVYLPNDVVMPWNWGDILYEAASDVPQAGVLSFKGQNLFLPEANVTGISGKEWSIGIKPGVDLNNECMVLGPVCLTNRFIEQCGLWDERFHPYGCEDFDICYRARLSGLRVFYLNDFPAYENKDKKEVKDDAYERFKTMMNFAQVGYMQWKAQNYHRVGVYCEPPMAKLPMGMG